MILSLARLTGGIKSVGGSTEMIRLFILPFVTHGTQNYKPWIRHAEKHFMIMTRNPLFMDDHW